VDTELEVPKMCIQTAAENAVKHGIFQLKEGGVITVNAVIQQDRLVIEVSDNGIGREASKKLQTSSTRKGNQLTQQYFDLYTKITNRKVTSEIVDLTDDSGNAAGTKVVISIQLN
jgi:sensor histidine kinase YesM